MSKCFGIVGCGRVAHKHAYEIKKVGNLQAVCDIDKGRADAFAKEHGGNVYYNLDDMLANEPNIDVVSICTPNGLHCEQSLAALATNKYVLCEKPLAINTEQATRMVAASLASEKSIYVVKQNRFNPPIVALKKLLDERKLGDIYSFSINCFWNRTKEYYQESSWRGTLDMDGGTLFTQFSHFIDILYWLLGDVATADATINNYCHEDIEIEDSGVAILKMRSGAMGTLNWSINAYEKNLEGSLTIIAEHGSVKIGGQYLNELEYQNIKDASIALADMENNPPNDYGYYRGSMSNHNHIYENLLNAMENPNFAYASAFDGLKTVEIIDKIYAAANRRDLPFSEKADYRML